MSAVTSTETRDSPDVLTTSLSHKASRRYKKRVCSKSTQAQPPWWVLCRGYSKLSPKHPCQDLREEGALQPRIGAPAQNLLSNTEFSHPTGLCQEKPSDHWGGDRPYPLVIQVKQPSESFDELLLMERPLFMCRWQRGREAAGLTPSSQREVARLGASVPVATT